jgi:hypothetical protein
MIEYMAPWLDQTEDETPMLTPAESKAAAKAAAKAFGYDRKPAPKPNSPEEQRRIADEVLRMKDEPK